MSRASGRWLIGLVLLAGALAGVRLLAVTDTLPESSSREDVRGLLARYRGAVLSIPAMEEVARQLQGQVVKSGPDILDGSDDVEAAAALSLLLVAAGDRSQAELLRTASLADSSRAGALRRVAAAALYAGDGESLLAAVASLSSGEPLVEIRRLAIRSKNLASGAALEERLEMEVEVSGWYLSESAP